MTSEQEYLPPVLLPYQQEAIARLEANTQVLVIEKSRRIGMTWALAAYAVLKAARTKAEGGMDFLYISYSQEMTREFIDACAMWARHFQAGAAEVGEFLFEDQKSGEDTRSIKAFRINLAFDIIGLSSAPRSMRGKQGVVLIDEAAFVDSLEDLTKSAMAMLMWGGQVIICSTHYGTENHFNKTIQDIHAGRLDYSHMRVDLDQALTDGLFRRICLVGQKQWTAEGEKNWRDGLVKSYGIAADEELFCIPAQGSGTWLTTALIQRQMTEPADKIIRWQWDKDYLAWGTGSVRQKAYLAAHLRELDPVLAQLNPQHQHAMGFDFARVANGDLSVLDVTSIDELLRRGTGLVLEMRGVPYEEQYQIAKYIWERLPRRKGAAFDATGAGGYVAEALSRRFGLYDQKLEKGGMIAEIKFSTDWYRQHMPKLKSAFEEDNIAIPRDALLEGDLLAVKVVQGVAIVPALRTGAEGLKRHGDYAVAKALAWYATLMNTSEIDYQAAYGSRAEGASDTFDYDRDNAEDDWHRPMGAALGGPW